MCISLRDKNERNPLLKNKGHLNRYIKILKLHFVCMKKRRCLDEYFIHILRYIQ